MAEDGRQRRPLSGMPTGIGTSVDNAAPTVVHAVNGSDEEVGGPYIDEITLWMDNANAAARTVTLTLNGVSMIIDLAAASGPKLVLDRQPMRVTGGANLTAQASGVDVDMWGWFVRG